MTGYTTVRRRDTATQRRNNFTHCMLCVFVCSPVQRLHISLSILGGGIISTTQQTKPDSNIPGLQVASRRRTGGEITNYVPSLIAIYIIGATFCICCVSPPLLEYDTECHVNTDRSNRACKSRARKRGWGQLGAGNPQTPC